MTSKRLFLAIPVRETLVTEIQKHRQTLDLDLKWIVPAKLHVTVYFFGNIPENSLEDLSGNIKMVSDNAPPFRLTATSLLMKSSGSRHMVWVGFLPSAAYENMVYEIAGHTSNEQKRKPLPHINLARSRNKIISDRLPLPLTPPHTIEVNHVELWESKLSPAGSTYLPLQGFTLKGK